MQRKIFAVLAISALFAVAASPSSAVVGGTDAAPGEFPSVAEITFGAFGCTGTLIDPTHVLSAGHCGSATGAAVASPVGWPTPLINVRIGSNKPGQGERVPVCSVTVSPDYLGLTSGTTSRSSRSRALRSTRRRRSRAPASARSGTRARSRRSPAGASPRRAATLPTPCRRRRCRSRPTRTARSALQQTSTRRRWSAPATPRAGSTPARATPAGRCSPAGPPRRRRDQLGRGLRAGGHRPGVYARVAEPRCASGSQSSRPTASTKR